VAALDFDCRSTENWFLLIATGKNQLSKDDTMGLYVALEALPAGERLEYTNGEGTTVVFETFVRVPGRIDVIVRTESRDAIGKYDEPRREYEGVDRDWCENEEKALRAAGIDPEGYIIV
jgi:hypothetical protein